MGVLGRGSSPPVKPGVSRQVQFGKIPVDYGARKIQKGAMVTNQGQKKKAGLTFAVPPPEMPRDTSDNKTPGQATVLPGAEPSKQLHSMNSLGSLVAAGVEPTKSVNSGSALGADAAGRAISSPSHQGD